MAVYIVKRLMSLVPVLLAITLLVFVMIHLVPGDPVAMMLGEAGTSQAAVDQAREQLGLNDPLPTQYLRFLSGILRGDLGKSMLRNQSVTALILDRLPSTLVLTLTGLGIATLVGVVVGVLAAVRQNSMVDNVSMVAAMLGVSMPSFWLGLMMIFLFSLHLGWLPATGSGGFNRLIMPAVTLGYAAAALITRMVRATMLDVLNTDYIRTARAKGLGETAVRYKHALVNAMIPVVTVLGLEFGRLMGGAVVIETVFSRPGIGRLAVTAILSKDYPLVQGVVLVQAVIFLLANLIVDVSYAYIDPRIRYQ